MIVNTNKRDEAIAAKTKVYTYFPELKAYLQYQSPYFKLKVGNFKDRKEAEDYQKQLNIYFPKGVFIMNDLIEVKPQKNSDIEMKPQPWQVKEFIEAHSIIIEWVFYCLQQTMPWNTIFVPW